MSQLTKVLARCVRNIVPVRNSVYWSRYFTPPFDGQATEPPPLPQPTYAPKSGESVAQRKARLLYQSRKRGITENGILLGTFASKYLSSMTPDLLSQYDDLLNQADSDWDIYNWITGAKSVPERYNTRIMKLLQEFVKNEHRENRLRQPDLRPTDFYPKS